MLEIKNEVLTVAIDCKGAQLTHVINNQTGFDYIWNGKEWAKHAPILFPAIGRSTNDSYLLDGKKYAMPQHGFISEYDFELISHEAKKAVLSFKSNETTYKRYPFDFELQVTFALENNQLAVDFKVKNFSKNDMSYSLGFHPAFNVDGKFEDYTIHLEPNMEKLQKFEIVKNPFPYRSGKIKRIEGVGSDFVLNHQIFDEGLVILADKVNQVILAGTHYRIGMSLDDFSFLCLWTKEDEALPFLCMEPFLGLPDKIDEWQELANKEGNDKLESYGERKYQCRLTFE